MPFAYVTEPGAVVRKQGECLSVTKDGKTLAEWKLIHVEGLILFGGAQLTTPAMTALLSQHIETAFVTQNGKLLGQLVSPKSGNAQVRVAQYRLSVDTDRRVRESQPIVRAKIAAMSDVLVRYAENYPDLPLKRTRERLHEANDRVTSTQTLDELRGVEGAASAIYWVSFPLLNRSELPFDGRSRRPPRDPVNALLSLGYVFLANELRSSLEAVGLDPYLGVYHDLKANRPSLALDLMEPFRHHIVDRFVLRAVNLGRFRPNDFQIVEDEGVRLQPSAMKTFIAEYERCMKSEGADPVQGTSGAWRDLLRQTCERWRDQLRPSADALIADDSTQEDGLS